MPFSIERNDLAALEVDAIVVPANEQLLVTGGAGAAVAKAAGFEKMREACAQIGFCATGEAVATPAFDLHARCVVHAVGPMWADDGIDRRPVLRHAYDSALGCALAQGAHSIALPLLSAGSFGFPPEVSFSVAMDATRAFLDENDDVDVRLVLYDRAAVRSALALYGDIESYIDDAYARGQETMQREYARQRPYAADRGCEGPYPGNATRGYAAPNASMPMPDLRSAPEAQASRQAPPPLESRGMPRAKLPRRKGGAISRLGEAITERLADLRERSKEPFEQLSGASGSEALLEAEELAVEAETAAEAPAPAAALEAEPSRWFCPQCGRENYYSFCVSCGAPSPRMASPGDAGTATGYSALAEPAAAFSRADMLEDELELAAPAAPARAPLGDGADVDLDKWLAELDKPFSTMLLSLIDARGFTDAEVYKRANMSRQLFSKIRSDAQYRPTKKTVLALAVALKLDLAETDDLLRRAGFALSHSSMADVIIEYFIVHGVHDIFTINEALYAFDQPLL